MTENIRGIFKVKLFDKEVEIKANFKAIDELERNIFKKPLLKVLVDIDDYGISFGDIVSIIHAGLLVNDDTRYTRDQVGEYIHSQGFENYLQVCAQYLTYLVNPNIEPVSDLKKADDDKKK